MDQKEAPEMKIYFNFKITEREKAMLKKDAYAHEMNISEYLRWLIEKQHAEDGRD